MDNILNLYHLILNNMKKIVYIILIGIILFSCGNKKETLQSETKKVFLQQDSLINLTNNILLENKKIIEDPQKDTSNQDTLRNKNSIKKDTLIRLSDSQRKEQEYKEYQKRQRQIDQNLKRLDQQEKLMDSLILIKKKK
jgi:hypothetical protein